MGRAKEAMLIHYEDLARAAGYLVRQKVLRQCEIHGEIYGGLGFLEPEFWRNAMADRNRGEHGPVPWAAEMEAREFTDLLKEAYEDHAGDVCGYCEKHMAE